jgi:hypothetical protein
MVNMYRKTPPTGTEKLEFYLIWSLLVISIIGLGMLFVLSSSGAEVPRGGPLSPEVPPPSPFILTENEANKVLRLWAPPDDSVSVVYDQWNIYIVGSPNETYTVEINKVERFNGTLTGEYINYTFDASRINNAHVVMKIGNRSYSWANMVINHQAVGFDDSFLHGEEEQYTSSDLNRARFKGAVAVVISSVITIPIVWWGVRTWRNKQGVTQW